MIAINVNTKFAKGSNVLAEGTQLFAALKQVRLCVSRYD